MEDVATNPAGAPEIQDDKVIDTLDTSSINTSGTECLGPLTSKPVAVPGCQHDDSFEHKRTCSIKRKEAFEREGEDNLKIIKKDVVSTQHQDITLADHQNDPLAQHQDSLFPFNQEGTSTSHHVGTVACQYLCDPQQENNGNEGLSLALDFITEYPSDYIEGSEESDHINTNCSDDNMEDEDIMVIDHTYPSNSVHAKRMRGEQFSSKDANLQNADVSINKNITSTSSPQKKERVPPYTPVIDFHKLPSKGEQILQCKICMSLSEQENGNLLMSIFRGSTICEHCIRDLLRIHKNSGISDRLKFKCRICCVILEEKSAGVELIGLVCGHIFCNTCLKNKILTQKFCSVCKRHISSGEIRILKF